EVLLANDQLRLAQRRGAVFQGYHEGRLHFPPTFKFVPGGSQYSQQRVPSWTDRVTQLYYDSVRNVVTSDHKPVVAGFEVTLGAAAPGGAAGGERDGGEAEGGGGCGCGGGGCAVM
ncbi:MAG: hypothetical protein J3K34DRAFT_372915, partial [Monoraphidium minutum]